MILFVASPIITVNLVNQTLGLNSTATFYCEYNSIIPTTVTWYKDGKLLLLNVNESKLVSTTTNNSSTLILANIEETDSGQYSCIVSNSIGITNSSGVLTVGKRIKVFTTYYYTNIRNMLLSFK